MRPAESYLGQPIRSLQTMLRLIAEHDPSHVQIVPDGIYGPETVRAVNTFQRIHGLPVTGITDHDTWQAIVAAYEPALIHRDAAHPLQITLDPSQVIRKGERHPSLHLAQAMLLVLADAYSASSSPEVNGLLDESTADALASFQQLNGLPMTGHLDKHTWKHLVLHYALAEALWDRDMDGR